MKTKFTPASMLMVACLLSARNDCWADALGDFMPPERAMQATKAWKQLKAGNEEALQAAAASRDMEMLWTLYLDAWGNRSVRALVAPRLAAIPGHAKYAGDLVETITTTTYDPRKPVQAYSGIMPREYAFRILDGLGVLATPEAIQQLGRFLYDTRNPESIHNEDGSHRGDDTNERYAVRALNEALGEKSPIFGKAGRAQNLEPEMFYTQVLREWWASDASLSYRQPLPGVELPEIVKNPPKLPHVFYKEPAPPIYQKDVIRTPHKPTAQATAAAQALLNRPPEKPHPFALPSRKYTPPAAAPVVAVVQPSEPWWPYGLLIGVLIIVAVWLSLKRRRKA